MIFAVLDDRGVMVHDSLGDVQREHEGIDANRRKKLLGFIEGVQNGAFSLQAAQSQGLTPFVQLLQEAAYLHPNAWFASLDELREQFGRGR